jgi:undecaprenyl-diphosphatase
VLLALFAFAGLALLANTTPVFQTDVLITRNLQEEMPSWFGILMQIISWPGYGIQSTLIVAGIAAILAAIGLRWEAVVAVVTGATAGALNTLVKVSVHRPRPGADLVNVFQVLNSYSFPSGHVMFYTAFFGFLLFLSFTLLKRTWLRYLINTILIVLIALVGVSRMYLGEHWASDVLGGYLLGSLVLIVSILFYRWGKERFFVRQPVAAQTNKTPASHEEKKEIKEALKNPLLMQKEQVKQEVKEDVKDTGHERYHSDRPKS